MESSDGKALHYTRGSRLMARLLASGKEQEVLGPGSISNSAWIAFDDGVYHVVRQGDSRTRGFEVRFLSFATGRDEVLHRSDFWQGWGFTVSPERQTILCAASAAPNADLMLVENFR